MLPDPRLGPRSADWNQMEGEVRVRSRPARAKGVADLAGTILLAFLQAGTATAQASTMPASSSTEISHSAQAGTISATVKDAAGGVIVHAGVAVISEAGGVTVKSQTDALGQVHMRELAAGSYDVKVEMKGFKTFLLKDVSVTPARDVENEITLQVAPIVDSWPTEHPEETEIAVVISATDFGPLPLAPVSTVPYGPKQNRIKRLLTRIRTKF